MRNLLIAAALVLAACSSSAPATPKQQANIPDPEFEIRQIVGPAEQNYDDGPIEVKYRLNIGNRADIPITLARVEIVTVNPPGGAYTLDNSHRVYYFRRAIPPHQAANIEFWARAIGYGQSMRDSEPVTVRGTLYFESPDGYLRHVFVKELGQYAGQND
jgi:hypothetical protein